MSSLSLSDEDSKLYRTLRRKRPTKHIITVPTLVDITPTVMKDVNLLNSYVKDLPPATSDDIIMSTLISLAKTRGEINSSLLRVWEDNGTENNLFGYLLAIAAVVIFCYINLAIFF